MGNFFGGMDGIRDPGGPGLLRKAYVEDVGGMSHVLVRDGTGVLMQIDGEWSLITEGGRHPLPSTGIWTFFPGVQNLVSKGVPTHMNEFYFFDLDPNVYRDIQFLVEELICIDVATQLQIKCTPTVNVSVRIVDPFKFFKELVGFDLSNDAVATFMHNRVAPWIKSELYKQSKSKPIIDVNADAIGFAKSLDSMLKDMLDSFGLEVKLAQVIKLGVSQEDLEYTRKYYEDLSEAVREAKQVKTLADSLFDGDKEKAVNYILMKHGLSQDVGFNPLLWKMMEKYLK